MLRALIFDVDGTLADTERDGHRVAFNRAFAEAGLPWYWSVPEYGDLLRVAGGRERLQHYMQEHQLVNDPARRRQLADELHEGKTVHYRRMVESGAVALRPGVMRLLANAHNEGLALAIATTTSRANIDALFLHTMPQALPWFSVIAAAEDAPHKKPDPQVYEFTLIGLGLEPHECVAFEDSANGLIAANAASIPTVITLNEYTADQDFQDALCVLSDLGEPDARPRQISGPELRGNYVDVAQLRLWHEQCVQPKS